MDYWISEISPLDLHSQYQMECLLARQGLERDKHLDYSAGVFDSEYGLVATGSCFGKTLRCLAVSPELQGTGILSQLVSHLIEVQVCRGNTHLFLYTKVDTAPLLRSLGFYEIARVGRQLVFMENTATGFSNYLDTLRTPSLPDSSVAAVVINANPFTLGHQYLVQQAASQADLVHLFVLSEDHSLVPYSVRYHLVRQGCAHLSNVCLHPSGDYMISCATFPSYFIHEPEHIVRAQAALDAIIFTKIAHSLGITIRFFGEETSSQTTLLYNQTMADQLPQQGITCRVLERLNVSGIPVSASRVRQLIHDGQLSCIRPFVPDCTWDYFQSPQALPVIQAIQESVQVVHH